MAADLQNPIFHDETKAREWLEARVWPNGCVCPHCGATEERTRRLEGKAHRAGLYQCNACREQFTATVGTVMERSKIPLPKWLMAVYLLSASKKGMSAHQLSRMLGVSYKSTWFMMHRIREAMREPSFAAGPLGGADKVVEADETYVGGKAKNRKNKVPPKEPVVALVERDGNVRGYHVANVDSETLRPILVEQIEASSRLMTDESKVYTKVGKTFASHETVNHSIEEYVRGDAHTQTVENYFSLLKRGIVGVYHHVSAAHLKRYVGEFDFRYNTRKVTDMERAALAAEGIKGKRMTYRRTGEAAHA
jgi:transposase-like protein